MSLYTSTWDGSRVRKTSDWFLECEVVMLIMVIRNCDGLRNNNLVLESNREVLKDFIREL